MTETTTVWEFLFPEIHRETANASKNVREDLSTFLQTYAQHLDDLYQAIDQNPCQTWSSAPPVGLKYPFPTVRTLDEFFEGHDDDLIYPIKIITSFITYINESVTNCEKDFYLPISMFGETVEEIKCPHDTLQTESGIPHGDLEKMIGQAIPIFIKLASFLPEFVSVGKRFVEYLLFLYSPQNEFFNDYFQSTPLVASFEALGRFMRVLHTLTLLISDNPALADGWEQFRHMVFGITKAPDSYKATQEDITLLQNSLLQIHRIVFSGNLLDLFFQQIAPMGASPAGRHFGANLERFLDDEIVSYTKLVQTGDLSDQEESITDLTLEFHFLVLFNPSPRSRIINNLWNTYTTVPIVKLYHYVSFCPVLYLQDNVPTLVANAIGADAYRQTRQKMLASMSQADSQLGSVANRIFERFCRWQARPDKQLMKGVQLAFFVRSAISRTIDLHYSFSQSIDMGITQNMGRLIELLKAIQSTFVIKQAQIAHNIPRAAEAIIKILDGEQQNAARIMRRSKYKPIRSRASNIMKLAYHCVKFFSSTYSQACIRTVADLYQSKALSGLGFTRDKIFNSLHVLQVLSQYNKEVDRGCDLSFLVDSRELCPLFLRFVKNDPRRIVFLVQAFNDIGDTVKNDPSLYEKMENFFIGILREEFISPILSNIETELRFHSHEHLAVSERNPLKKSFSSFDKFLTIPPFRLLTKMIDIHYEACYYFTLTFYNETAVSPQVWETYSKMANLAERLYGITVLDGHIPGAMMQQEIDVLEIIRNIPAFSQIYNYDLNSQVFVQRSEDSHHISIVGIPHIFSSYRCHGIGIMNTTVNSTYRFLRLEFNVFSRFLYNDEIKSRLINDIAYFAKNKDALEGMWPVERADKFVTDMKRMGASASNLSALDTFRIRITEIGNALGFVRMVKSGGTRYLNNAIGFVYDEDGELSFKKFAEEVQLADATMIATERLDSIVGKLKELFTSPQSFFKQLVDAFAPAFRDKKNTHLENFYMIVPPLTLSYIEHIAVMKDNALKQNKNSSFSDDGFPMGLAFILKLLDQDALFDSLHWFDSLHKHSEEEKKAAQNNSQSKSWLRSGNAQTVRLALQMIERRQREFELLQTTVHSARILFN